MLRRDLAIRPKPDLALRAAEPMTTHEAALLRHSELVQQIEADRADPTQAVLSRARRPR